MRAVASNSGIKSNPRDGSMKRTFLQRSTAQLRCALPTLRGVATALLLVR